MDGLVGVTSSWMDVGVASVVVSLCLTIPPMHPKVDDDGYLDIAYRHTTESATTDTTKAPLRPLMEAVPPPAPPPAPVIVATAPPAAPPAEPPAPPPAVPETPPYVAERVVHTRGGGDAVHKGGGANRWVSDDGVDDYHRR